MQKYLYNKHGINYAFDTLVGINYYDMVEMLTIEYDKIIRLKGNYLSITGVLKRLNESNVNYRINSLMKKDEDCLDHETGLPNENFKMKTYKNIIEGFMRNKESFWFEDMSNYTIELEKLS